MKYIVIFIFALSLQFSFGQTKSLNAYEYVIVPMKFNFQSESNQYNLNILARVLFQEEGFIVYMDEEEKPLALNVDPCKSLRADVIDGGGFLTTKVSVVLLDCSGNTIYKTAEGVSRIKDYKHSYKDALRKAFKSFSTASYAFDESLNTFKDLAYEVDDILESSHSNLEDKYPNKSIYKFGGESYWLVSNSSGGYDLLSNQGKINYAQLEKADKGSFVFNTKTINGAAYFDAEANLLVEYMDRDLNEIQNVMFKKID
jgi:hypothetical protein